MLLPVPDPFRFPRLFRREVPSPLGFQHSCLVVKVAAQVTAPVIRHGANRSPVRGIAPLAARAFLRLAIAARATEPARLVDVGVQYGAFRGARPVAGHNLASSFAS